MSDKRNHFSPEEKVAILKEHLLDKVPVSDICDKYGIHPNLFYKWQKDFFENGAVIFERKRDKEKEGLKEKIEYLEKKLSYKSEVLSELMEEHIRLKKNLGEI